VLRYEWDDAKNRGNLAKHGLDFADAQLVFAGPCVHFAVAIAHAPRDEATRIISMRKANRREQEIYQKRLGAA
jgi:uncharacterized DUF497 family protein